MSIDVFTGAVAGVLCGLAIVAMFIGGLTAAFTLYLLTVGAWSRALGATVIRLVRRRRFPRARTITRKV